MQSVFICKQIKDPLIETCLETDGVTAFPDYNPDNYYFIPLM